VFGYLGWRYCRTLGLKFQVTAMDLRAYSSLNGVAAFPPSGTALTHADGGLY